LPCICNPHYQGDSFLYKNAYLERQGKVVSPSDPPDLYPITLMRQITSSHNRMDRDEEPVQAVQLPST
jgi:hypothetical protein